ncbi:MAG: tRNA-dihydrouridine synthase family protein [Candidatus Woesearchaeota archaeon]|nr:tRNA-dihydrouridine synthase family protein [Candidatus Woesearchaeota archaeon]
MLPKNLFRQGLFLAPMANYSDIGLRTISFSYGADYTFSEMVSAHEIFGRDITHYRELDFFDQSVPTGLQIITPSPEMLKKAIEKIKSAGGQFSNISSICLNLGCPKLKKSGAFLLDKMEIIEELFSAMHDTSNLPTCVKMRLGINLEHMKEKPHLRIARLAEKYLDFIIVHGRTKNQVYSGEIDLKSMREIKDSVSIPVVGNGDIKNPKDAEKMFSETGCDAIMIGRAACSKPYLFREIRHYLKTGEELIIDEKKEKILCVKRYLELQKKYNLSLIQAKIHILSFLKSCSKSLKVRIAGSKEIEEIRGLVEQEYKSF